MKRALGAVVVLLTASVAGAAVFGGGGGGAGAVVDVLAELLGENVSANSYTATTATGPGLQCNGNLASCVRLGSGTRAYLGTNSSGDILLGPDDGSNATGVRISGYVRALSAQFIGPVDLLADNAYLTNNAGVLRLYDLDGISFNDTTPLKGRVALAVTFDSAAINNGTCLAQSVTVTGAALGDSVKVNADFELPDTVMIGNARVTAPNTVALRLCNVDVALAKDPVSGPYNFVLER